MSSRNATASWSGYAHQGKIGLLVALRKIIRQNCSGLSDFSVEQETKEDVCLKNGDIILEVHQVKAYMSSNAVSSYTKALSVFEAGGSDNYLHTILDIDDWDTIDVTTNPFNVQRYSYSINKSYCGLDEIENYILEDINTILSIAGSLNYGNPGWCQKGYQEYLAMLDHRIRVEHQYGVKSTYCVSINLDEILAIILNPPSSILAVTCAIRKAIFEQYLTFINILEYGGYTSMSPDHEKAITEVIAMFCKLGDDKLEEFLIQIFPSSTKGKRLAACILTDDFFVSTDFASTFLKTLITIETIKPVIEDGTYPHYKKDKNYLITALQQHPDLLSVAAKNILENDRLNTARYEADYIINEHFEGKLSDHASRNISRTNGIISENDIEFITREEATTILNRL